MSEKNILEQYNITEKDLLRAIMALKGKGETAERNNGRGLMRHETIDELFEAEYKLARLCADMGNIDCTLLLGELLQGGKVKIADSEDNVMEAVKWWEKGAEAGMSRGYTNLGLIHLHKPIPGGGSAYGSVPYDPEKAFGCFLKAFELGDIKAGRHVGICYLEGVGVEKDEAKGFEYMTKAMERHDSTATLYVADCLLKGIGTEQNVEKAIELYKHLHEVRGHDVTTGAYALACIYRDGVYAEKNPALAEKYFRSVVETADAHALDLLAEAKKYLGIE